MAYSSILGGETAPTHASGKQADLLGPSDSSDSGSDSIGELAADQLSSDGDRNGTGDRASADPFAGASGADILPDRVVRLNDDGSFSDEGEAAQLSVRDAGDEADDPDAP